MESIAALKTQLTDNKKGLKKGVYSVCSAHRAVLAASILQAKSDDSFLIIESTSNQVDQFGGYTGMTPLNFVEYVRTIAGEHDFPFERIILGGDHLGPNAWQQENAASAMVKARDLVKAYAEAGYRKIHLDASMFCADDKGDRDKPLADEIVAGRVVELCRVCEAVVQNTKPEEKPLYIIGTEVPVPGGAKENEDSITPTAPDNLRATLDITKKAFLNAGLHDAWDRVIAVVAQPGVEFSDDKVFYYNRENAFALSHALDNEQLVFEAHSTDYQTERCLKEMVEDHFCILKVGPWLTYAYREAVFALENIEKEMLRNSATLSHLSKVIETVMLTSNPNYWHKYYHGNEAEQYLKRRLSFSDRIRYYWTNPLLVESVKKLFGNLAEVGIPLSLISQYMPMQFMQVSDGRIKRTPHDLVLSHIRDTAGIYARACGWGV
jgi:D-tagatose-1,6-bisphosphate aldolase subunit GatZ/KbaZ